MKKTILEFKDLYVAIHEPKEFDRYVLFVHGGPGGNSAIFEEALQTFEAYSSSGLGWICFDQRGCGRSVKGGAEVTHLQNIEDLNSLVEFLLKRKELPLQAVMGHSYGARLVFDSLTSRNTELKTILLSLGTGATAPRNRSLAMDLLALKITDRSKYENAYQLVREHRDGMWMLAKPIREMMANTALRKFFYWGNLEAMNWYFTVKQRLKIDECDATYHSVRTSMYQGDSQLALPDGQSTHAPLWILGFHDFLMSGESVGDCPYPINLFQGSGHYPHLEEPKKLVQTLELYLNVKHEAVS